MTDGWTLPTRRRRLLAVAGETSAGPAMAVPRLLPAAAAGLVASGARAGGAEAVLACFTAAGHPGSVPKARWSRVAVRVCSPGPLHRALPPASCKGGTDIGGSINAFIILT